MFKTAEIVVVGSEFFSRDKRDTNSIWLTEELEKRGVRVTSKVVVADVLGELTRVVKHGLEAVDLVISTGGLGPTEDDRTREAVARAVGRRPARCGDSVRTSVKGGGRAPCRGFERSRRTRARGRTSRNRA